jgi:hypothetical protein
MSLAAALKKGLETADSIGNWDPFAEESKAGAKAPRSTAVAPTGPANTNAAARALAPRTPSTGPQSGPISNNPISAVRGGSKSAVPAKAAPTQAAATPAARPSGSAQQRVAVRQAGQGQKGSAKPVARANWLHDAVPGGRVNAAQYVRELDRFAAEENRRAVSDVVMEVNQSEVEGVVRHAARIKGRYLAKQLHVGNKAKSGVMEAEVNELTRYRETYEELARGLDILKSAIEAGDISVSGTVRR